MFLSPDEVAELTGYKRLDSQTRWLKQHEFGFVIGGDGRPKVLKQFVLLRLSTNAIISNEPKLRLRS